MSILDHYITRSEQGNVLWLGPESLKQLTAEVEALETEVMEQATLLGKSGSREAALLAKLNARTMSENKPILGHAAFHPYAGTTPPPSQFQGGVLKSVKKLLVELGNKNEHLENQLHLANEKLKAQECQNVVKGADGTQYCALAESSVQKLIGERDALRAEVNQMLHGRTGFSRDQGAEMQRTIKKLREHAEAVMEALHNYQAAEANANWQQQAKLNIAEAAYRNAFPRDPKP